MGVNHNDYNASKHQVISAASCTTNCLAPATKIINDNFGIKSGLMTTIHAYTMSQRILDGSDKDLRRGRAAAMSLIPTSTGAARAIGLVIPELKGKIDGMAVRVPTPDGSMVDVVYELESKTTVQEVNAVLKEAAEGKMKGYMGYSEEPLVSIDYIGDIHGGVVDSLCTNVMDGTLLKLIIWYDNEAGFTISLCACCCGGQIFIA
jgi:glyceraldehyde-3-phosphate dehydrogenase (EC 1.2.1.12)